MEKDEIYSVKLLCSAFTGNPCIDHTRHLFMNTLRACNEAYQAVNAAYWRYFRHPSMNAKLCSVTEIIRPIYVDKQFSIVIPSSIRITAELRRTFLLRKYPKTEDNQWEKLKQDKDEFRSLRVSIDIAERVFESGRNSFILDKRGCKFHENLRAIHVPSAGWIFFCAPTLFPVYSNIRSMYIELKGDDYYLKVKAKHSLRYLCTQLS